MTLPIGSIVKHKYAQGYWKVVPPHPFRSPDWVEVTYILTEGFTIPSRTQIAEMRAENCTVVTPEWLKAQAEGLDILAQLIP